MKRNRAVKIRFHITHTDAELEKKITKMEELKKAELLQPEQPEVQEEDDDEFIGWDELITPSEPGLDYDKLDF